jgi:hypothetical protein
MTYIFKFLFLKKIYLYKMKKLLFIIVFFLMAKSYTQEHAWIYFIDKPDSSLDLINPLSILSQRALDRRARQNISLDITDIPISSDYINQISALNGVEVKAKSKWLNAVHVYGSQMDIRQAENLSIVDHIEFASHNISRKTKNKAEKFKEKITNYNYGGSLNQNEQIGVKFLHENNLTGQGLVIAVMDNGFGGVNTYSAFQHLRDNNSILGSYNFVQRNNNLNTGGTHGTSVLSTIAAIVDGELIGTAPDAKFYLFVTEDVNSETPLEESLWVEAAEKADSLGVDIINTSLGYRDFDDSKYNHTYEDFDGATTFIARAASMLASKGIIATIAAGNDGNGFHYISTPADAKDVLTVGAVDSNGDMASFSSYGPTADGRVKPDVCAKGENTTIVNSNGEVGTGSGTSFASPVMCGAVACLWQAFPDKTSYELMDLIRQSAHLYNNPDDHYGYGIPDFSAIYTQLDVEQYPYQNIQVYPNPTSNFLYFTDKVSSYQIFNISGSVILSNKTKQADIQKVDISNLPEGIYFLNVQKNDQNKIMKIIKK